MTDKSLSPSIQKEVLFYEDTITAVQVEFDGQEQIYVPVRPICNQLGLDWSAQYRRVNRDPVLSGAIQGVAIMATPSADGRGGGLQEMSCLPLKFLPGWLFGINANRVKPELRDKIIRYQRESYDVLWEAFQEGRLTADPAFDDLLNSDSDAVQAYRMAVAIMKMARQQILLEARLDTYDTQLSEHENRLEMLEGQLGTPESLVTPEQAMQLSQGVKSVAYELGKKSKRNEFGGVYGEMYRRYGINSYKALPKDKFESALGWLNDWLQTLIGDTPF